MYEVFWDLSCKMKYRRCLKSYAFGGIVAVVQLRLLKFSTYMNMLYFEQ